MYKYIEYKIEYVYQQMKKYIEGAYSKTLSLADGLEIAT